MKLNRRERDYYLLIPKSTVTIAGTWQASFVAGRAEDTWIAAETIHQASGFIGPDGKTTVKAADGMVVTDALGWLVAGPDFDAEAVGMDPADTKATLALGRTVVAVRNLDDPVLDETDYQQTIDVQ